MKFDPQFKEWTAEGWPKAMGGDLARTLAKPGGAAAGPHVLPLSDDFSKPMFGTRRTLYSPGPGYLNRARFSDGALTLAGNGDGPATSSPLAMIAGDRSYQLTVELDLQGAAQGGLLLFYDQKLFCGLGVSDGRFHSYKTGQELRFPPAGNASSRHVHLRVVNDYAALAFKPR